MTWSEEESDCWNNTSSLGRCNPTIAQWSLLRCAEQQRKDVAFTVFVNDERLDVCIIP